MMKLTISNISSTPIYLILVLHHNKILVCGRSTRYMDIMSYISLPRNLSVRKTYDFRVAIFSVNFVLINLFNHEALLKHN